MAPRLTIYQCIKSNFVTLRGHVYDKYMSIYNSSFKISKKSHIPTDRVFMEENIFSILFSMEILKFILDTKYGSMMFCGIPYAVFINKAPTFLFRIVLYVDI